MNFIGPSYRLANAKADYQRSVNLYLQQLEVAGTKSQPTYILDSVPGQRVYDNPAAEIRGTFTAGSRTFVVAGSSLLEYPGAVFRGSLLTSTGPVDMDYGTTQLVIVDGTYGYVLTLASNAFVQITADGFYGSKRVCFLDNYFIFVRPDSGQFTISGINDATSDDALDFATAESQPDNLQVALAVQRRLILLGALSIEIWFDSGAQDFPFEREGTTIEVGCIAPYSARVLDNTIFWLGQDKNGAGIVYRLDGYQAVRISQEGVEEALQTSTDLSNATAYAYQQNGLLFYVLQAPGLKSTWVYEVKTSEWHERCDVDDQGNFIQDRGVCHTYGQGLNLQGGSDGVLYVLDKNYYQKGSDYLVRERTSPHTVVPLRRNQFSSQAVLDCSTGENTANVDTFVELSWLDWTPGSTWSTPILKSIGKVGERFARLLFTRLGFARDRVWRVRYSGNAPFSIINFDFPAKTGTR